MRATLSEMEQVRGKLTQAQATMHTQTENAASTERTLKWTQNKLSVASTQVADLTEQLNRVQSKLKDVSHACMPGVCGR